MDEKHQRKLQQELTTMCASGEFAVLYPLHDLMQVEFIAASGTPTAPVLVLIWLVGVVVVACCCCILLQLALMLILTFAPCTGVPLLPLTGANTPLVHVLVSTCCNLHWWCFSAHQLAQILHLHTWSSPLQLALVVFFFQPLVFILHLHSCNLHCVVVCIYHMVVTSI